MKGTKKSTAIVPVVSDEVIKLTCGGTVQIGKCTASFCRVFITNGLFDDPIVNSNPVKVAFQTDQIDALIGILQRIKISIPTR